MVNPQGHCRSHSAWHPLKQNDMDIKVKWTDYKYDKR